MSLKWDRNGVSFKSRRTPVKRTYVHVDITFSNYAKCWPFSEFTFSVVH